MAHQTDNENPRPLAPSTRFKLDLIQNQWPETMIPLRTVLTVGLRRCSDSERASVGSRRCQQSARDQKRWPLSLVRPRTIQNRRLPTNFSLRTLNRWHGTMLPLLSLPIVGFQRGCQSVRASVGLRSVLEPAPSKIEVQETDRKSNLDSNREALSSTNEVASFNQYGP